jgi:glycosyltransferase involved in cell wall biosynthesis
MLTIRERLKAYLVPRLYKFVSRNFQYIAEKSNAAPPPIVRPIWNHPWLNASNISAFATYSAQVRAFALDYAAKHPAPLRVAFCNNMAQNMYKWACMAQRFGHNVELFCRMDDKSALSMPQWEEYDGEAPDIMSLQWQQGNALNETLKAPCRWHEPDGDISRLWQCAQDFKQGRDLRALAEILPATGSMPLLSYLSKIEPLYYLNMALDFQEFDVLFSAADHIPSLLSGLPYNILCVGGDADILCSRRDWYGAAQRLALLQARFLHLSNPHMLGHCRRLGLRNAAHIPYPMDDAKYCPGPGKARAQWEAQNGPGCYVLTTARLDSTVKGHTTEWWQAVIEAVSQEPSLRFVFLCWGESLEIIRDKFRGTDLEEKTLFLKPVGKVRLIDYYRSCDLVMDQFTYGYYGATGLEAAACGCPVIMFLRQEQYAPLYSGDTVPMNNCASPQDLVGLLTSLAREPELRRSQGYAMRDWLVRNHGEQRTAPFMMAFLRLAADRVRLPKDLHTPLAAPLVEDENDFHREYENW